MNPLTKLYSLLNGSEGEPRKITIHAASGNVFPKPGVGMQTRIRTRAQAVELMLKRELYRCAAPNKRCKVIEVDGILYANIYSLRGLDPDLVWSELKRLPWRCGVARVFLELVELEQRVVPKSRKDCGPPR